jgi:hypothetical protein
MLLLGGHTDDVGGDELLILLTLCFGKNVIAMSMSTVSGEGET